MRVKIRLSLLAILLVTGLVISLVSCQPSGDHDVDQNQWTQAPSRGRRGKKPEQRGAQPSSQAARGGTTKRSQRPAAVKNLTVVNPAPADAKKTLEPSPPRARRQYHDIEQQAASESKDGAGQLVALSSASFTMDKFIRLKSLGRGASGTVSLARHVDLGNHLFAIKEIKKPVNYQSPTDHSVQQVIGELNQATIKSPFVAILLAALQDSQKVYLVQEYAPGGTLHDLLQNQPEHHLDLEQAKFYIAELILGVKDIHEKGMMHRDIKTKNILVGSDGHLLLIDFGLSTQAVLANTRCGTLNYMAPEVTVAREKGPPYGKAVDLFSLGVILYEMLTGVTPFEGSNARITYRNIMHAYPDFDRLPVEADTDDGQSLRSLLLGLLEKNPAKRSTIDQVMKHPFFAGTNWDHIRAKAHDPPLGKPGNAGVLPRTPIKPDSYVSDPSAADWKVEPDDPFSGFDQVFRDRLHI